MKPIISAEELGKKYRILKGMAGTRNSSAPPSFFSRGPKLAEEDFWALRDIAFDIMPGERVGIIGRNGAGKSTLLKVLSRITEPTTGRVTMRGRVASLLEVGTGFHPELTGRENIFLNGAILGMGRKEILRKFDDIVDFAGVEQFLDVPVKRYSSGMYVRLGFAIAAHLEPEILIVDEVLAVGDADFQKKCLGKMEEVSTGQGRTVLFVSHNLSMVSTLCNRALFLQSGNMAFDGDVHSAIIKYMGRSSDALADFTHLPQQPDVKAVLRKLWFSHADGRMDAVFEQTESVCVHIEYDILCDVSHPAVPTLHFTTVDGTYLFMANMTGVTHGKEGRYHVTCSVPPSLFNAGQFSVGVVLLAYPETGSNEALFSELSILSFTVTEPAVTPWRYNYGGPLAGPFLPRCEWHTVSS